MFGIGHVVAVRETRIVLEWWDSGTGPLIGLIRQVRSCPADFPTMAPKGES